jgi:peptide/nickel transport system substrate-binding protein
MKRRTLLTGLAAAGAASLARPALVRAQSQTTLKFIPQIDLSFLDPHFTPAYVTRNHAYMVFDTLYGQDGSFAAQPQMVEGHTTEDDGKLWKLTLRPGLVWHDGQPVLARDCVASIRRWAKKDALGDALMQATDELSAPDDKTIRFRLKHPFPLLPDALGHAATYMPAMMPERLAATDSAKQVTDMVGSGPFRYLADQRLAGSRNVYEKFDRYVPRPGGTPDWTAGPKIVHYDRVEWTTIPDSATAAAALQNGEQDWWELIATFDLLPLLAGDQEHPDPHARPDRPGRDDAPQRVAAALQQPRHPPRAVGRHRPGRLHAGDRRRRPENVPRPAGLLLPRHADGERRRPRPAARQARL